MAREQPLHRRADRALGPRRNDHAGQKVNSAVSDPKHGQRIAALAVAGAEPALEVDAPAHRWAPRRGAACGAARQPGDGGGASVPALPSAADRPSCSPPATPVYRDDQRIRTARSLRGPQCGRSRRSATIACRHLRRHRTAVTMRRAGALHQALRTQRAIAAEPLVARLAARSRNPRRAPPSADPRKDTPRQTTRFSSGRRADDVRLGEPYRAHQGHPTAQISCLGGSAV